MKERTVLFLPRKMRLGHRIYSKDLGNSSAYTNASKHLRMLLIEAASVSLLYHKNHESCRASTFSAMTHDRNTFD